MLTKAMAMEDETILAWGMNGEALPDMHGAPLRLRTESMHGYKMVKWVRSVMDPRLRRRRRRHGRHSRGLRLPRHGRPDLNTHPPVDLQHTDRGPTRVRR